MDRLDWDLRGLSARSHRVVTAFAEALLSDEDDAGALVPPKREVTQRAVVAFDHSVGRGSADLRRGFAVLTFVLEWLPFFVLGAPSRMSRLPLGRRVEYLERLEGSSIGWLTMLLIAFKVPLAIPAFEEGDELASTGFDRPSTTARRRLPVQQPPRAPDASTAGSEIS